MIRLTLAQMRRSVGRLVAGGIAIGLGTAFLAATLLASSVLTRTTYDAVTTSLADADLVVTPPEWETLEAADLRTTERVEGVAAVQPQSDVYVDVVGPEGSALTPLAPLAADERLDPTRLVAGEEPTDDGILLPDDVAERLGLRLGQAVTLRSEVWPDDGPTTVVEEELTLTGLLDGSVDSFLGNAAEGVVTPARLDALRESLELGEPWYRAILVALDAGAERDAVQAALASALPDGVAVRTQDEHAQAVVADLSGSAAQFTAIVAGFAGVALLVAGLVIANTFQVLVAQRTRTLALLRCVGASRGQLRRSVVLEAVVVGATGSLAGVLLGTGAVQAALSVLRARGTDVPLPAVVPMSATAVVVPVLVGVLVTVAAALVPARAATRVSPLAALQPATAPGVGERGGRTRAVLSAVLVVGGTVMLVGGTIGAGHDLMLGLLVAMLGGAASLLGVLLGAVFWVPVLMRLVGRALGRSRSAAARLAAANSVRNPRRTAATSSALLIGVTLVVMMATGAASTQAALDAALDEEFPVDLATGTDGPGPLPAGFAEQVAAVEGVAAVAEVASVGVTIQPVDSGDEWATTAYAADPAALSQVLRTGDAVGTLRAGEVVVGTDVADGLDLGTGDTVALTTDAPGARVVATVAVGDLAGASAFLTPEDLRALHADVEATAVWVRLDDPTRADDAVADVEQVAVDTGEGLYVQGGAVERAFYQRVINTLLAVVIGLLGVAVIISVVGVTNTLSLSVIERRRESATLRALGLSRRQLRGTLAVEGVLIALAGTAVGVVLGVVYGWFGARTLLVEIGDGGVPLTVPWSHVGVVLVVAVLAGLLASAVPARTAARTPPVAALAVE